MNKNVVFFLGWRVLLFIGVYMGSILVLQESFLGGNVDSYLQSPELWWHANFDGVPYLAIAQEGYRPIRHFFFPVYPLLIRLLGFWATNLKGFLLSAVFISHLSFLFAIFGLHKLLSLDGIKTQRILLILFIFPASFFFAAVYTESLFLMLVVWAFYFARKNKFPTASLLAGLACATRVIGVTLALAILVEWFTQNKTRFRRGSVLALCLYLFIMASGLLLYFWFLYKETGDPLIFIHKVGIYGAQRSVSFVFLPQVFYRYFIKIIPSLPFNWPIIFTAFLEVLVAVLFLVLVVYGYFKLRLSYWVYLFGGYLVPTLSGSFSSLPRYVLVLFPAFILLSKLTRRIPKFVQLLLAGVSLLGLILATMLFSRGYWVS